MAGFLNNKCVVVTGGGRGIGREIALGCAREGAQVVITARSKTDLQATADEIRKVTDLPCEWVQGDVSRTEDMARLTEVLSRVRHPVYGLICAAGIYGSIGAFADLPFEDWEKAIDINLKGTARSIHCVLPWMKKSGGGRVILLSGGGQGSMPNFSAYVTSKGGIWRMTETLGAELAESQIYLNAIAPGAVNTQLLDELLKAGPERVGQAVYQKSLQQKDQGGESPEKAVQLCLYLLSERAKGLYGKTISAIWDRYNQFENLEAMSRSDIYTMRRVVNTSGGTRS